MVIYLFQLFAVKINLEVTKSDAFIYHKTRKYGFTWLIIILIATIIFTIGISSNRLVIVDTLSVVTTYIISIAVLFTLCYYPYVYYSLKKSQLFKDHIREFNYSLISDNYLTLLRNSYLHLILFFVILIKIILPTYNYSITDGLLNTYVNYFVEISSYKEKRTNILSAIDQSELRSEKISFPIEKDLYSSFLNLTSMEDMDLLSSKEVESIYIDKIFLIIVIFLAVNTFAILLFQNFLKSNRKRMITRLIIDSIEGLLIPLFLNYALIVFRQSGFKIFSLATIFIFIFIILNTKSLNKKVK